MVYYAQKEPPEVFLEILQNSQANTCVRVSFLIKSQASVYNFIEKEILARVFPCQLCEIFKDTFFTEYLWATASVCTTIVLS